MTSSKTPAEPGLFTEVWLAGRLEEHLHAVYADGSTPRARVLPSPGAPLTYTKLALARACGRVSRASGRGGGTTAPGRQLLRLAPGAIATLAARLPQGVVLVSATNGKTTTTRMLTAILESAGRSVVSNRAGANTHWGVCAALAEGDGELGVLEVDEAWLPLVAAETEPRLVVLGNLSRDRLDGYGELARLVRLWRELLAGPDAPRVVANADDPRLCGPDGVLEGAHPETLRFGLAAGSQPEVRATAVREHGLDGSEMTVSVPGGTFSVRLGQPGLHNVYNALAACAAASVLGVGPEAMAAGLRTARPAFGRAERIEVRGRPVHLCLVKNPAGVDAILRLLRHDRGRRPLHLWLALNDGHADGRDVSWIWDANFESLAGEVAAATCSGGRADELALRLKYAGWACPLAVEPDLGTSLDAALAAAPRGLVALPTYSALLGLRAVLSRRGVTPSDWGTSARSAA